MQSSSSLSLLLFGILFISASHLYSPLIMFAVGFSVSRGPVTLHVRPTARRCSVPSFYTGRVVLPRVSPPNGYSDIKRSMAVSSSDAADSTTTTSTHTHTLSSTFTDTDRFYLQHAITCAQRGLTHTFPNPAVGCVITQTTGAEDDKTDTIIIGQGFHPRAGWPHAEIFALLQAAQHVPCGVTAAQAIVDQNDAVIAELRLQELSETYRTEGASALFLDCCKNTTTTTTTTAYVTLEPCCHTGRTPPCAAALVTAGVDRVVMGVRDPNPKVDGGGMAVLQQKRQQQDEASTISTSNPPIEVVVVPPTEDVQRGCEELIRNFRKRITMPALTAVEYTGKEKRKLRAEYGRRQQTKTSMFIEWGNTGARISLPPVETGDGDSDDDDTVAALEQAVQDLPIAPEWMEHLDDVLWQHELVQIKLNKAVSKRKQAEALGRRIAEALGAQLIQSKGHGVVLYRPGMPPVLNWKTEEDADDE